LRTRGYANTNPGAANANPSAADGNANPGAADAYTSSPYPYAKASRREADHLG
jgi:hypothetical protein